MKRLCIAVLVIFLLVPMAYADDLTSKDIFELYPAKKVVGVFLEAPVVFLNNEAVHVLIPEKAAEMFSKNRFKLLPFDQTERTMRTYKEDNRMIMNQYASMPLNRADFQTICKDLGADYALAISVTNGAPRASSALFVVTFKASITCDVRLLDINTGEYVISKQIVKDGTSSGTAFGMPSFDHAYNEALRMALDELTIETLRL